MFCDHCRCVAPSPAAHLNQTRKYSHREFRGTEQLPSANSTQSNDRFWKKQTKLEDACPLHEIYFHDADNKC